LQWQSITPTLTPDSAIWARDELAYAREFDRSFSAAAAERIAAPLKLWQNKPGRKRD
jgi:hypothetical protein